MAAVPDRSSRLSEVVLCRLAGVDRGRRRAWAKAGLLRQGGQNGYGELDLIQLAVFRRLVAELEFDRARLAWGGVRPSLAAASLARSLWVVLNEGRAEAVLATRPEELRQLVEKGGRFQVVDVSDLVEEARTGFRNTVRAAKSKAGKQGNRSKVQELRKKNAKMVVRKR